jgi:hypothetical protein
MRDGQDELPDRLFQAARAAGPETAAIEDRVETRLMARLEEQRSSRAAWFSRTWRLVPWFATIVILVGAGSICFDPARSTDLFAPFAGGCEEYLFASLLAGG